MANKKPLTSSMEDYGKLLAYPRRIRHESTVGAGLPVIASLNRILSSGDPVHHIIGSLSGTMGYVMSEVEDRKPFSQVVKSAKSLGYSEPGTAIGTVLLCQVPYITTALMNAQLGMEGRKDLFDWLSRQLSGLSNFPDVVNLNYVYYGLNELLGITGALFSCFGDQFISRDK
ncbi:homoserine dehydrogenase-like [Camellia sinensis]|uniref:homoserine dehydrogenase-like n=1 Tax=Camellia sinensis TaxID=4442 RepID=UPI0010364F07|nr:homoserine dehydrogenase-like [Camellia sinensis]